MSRRTLTAGWLAVGVALLAAVAGCGDSTEPEAQAPQLPPAQSMQMDLGFFSTQEAPAITGFAGTRLNFANAVLRVALVNLAVLVVMTPPSLAFAAALNTIPSRQEDGSWLWIYTWVSGGQDHQVRLRGALDGDHVNWEMAVVPPGASAELWFSGRSAIARDQGYWVFRDFNLAGDPDVLRIDWQVSTADDAALTFTNIFDGRPEEGDELRYRANGSLYSLEFQDAAPPETWDITWNAADSTGSLRVPGYNNGVRACWDSNREDVACPPAAGQITR